MFTPGRAAGPEFEGPPKRLDDESMPVPALFGTLAGGGVGFVVFGVAAGEGDLDPGAFLADEASHLDGASTSIAPSKLAIVGC